MKMIICIIQDDDREAVIRALNENDFRVTLLPSSGAFFRRGNATIMIGVEEENVERVIQIIKNNSSDTEDSNLKRATLFVIDVERYSQV